MRMNKLKLNSVAAVGGDWIDEIDGMEDFAVFTSSMDAPAAIEYQRKMFKELIGRKTTRKGRDIPVEILDYVNAMTLIDMCVTDWKNWIDDKVDSDGIAIFKIIDGVETDEIETVEVKYSKEFLTKVLLEDAPDGIKVASNGKTFHTRNKKRCRYEYRDLLYILVDAADEVKYQDAQAEAIAKKPSAPTAATEPGSETARKPQAKKPTPAVAKT